MSPRRRWAHEGARFAVGRVGASPMLLKTNLGGSSLCPQGDLWWVHEGFGCSASLYD